MALVFPCLCTAGVGAKKVRCGLRCMQLKRPSVTNGEDDIRYSCKHSKSIPTQLLHVVSISIIDGFLQAH